MKIQIKNFVSRLKEYSLLAIIFFIPIYFAFFKENFNVFELDKIIFFRIALIIALLAYVAEIFWDKRPDMGFNKTIFALAALAGLSFLISTCFSLNPELSLWGSYDRQQGLYSHISYLLFLILVFLYLKKLERIEKVIITIVASSFFVCFYGLLQFFHLDPMNWSETTNRIFSSFGQPNFFGQYLIIVIPITVYCLFFVSRNSLSRFVVFFIALLQLACLAFTYSRSAWLGLIGTAFVAVVLFFWAKRYKKIVAILLSLGAIVIAGVIFLSFYYSSHPVVPSYSGITLSERMKSVFNVNSGSNKIRLYYWQAAIDEFRKSNWERRLIGYGPETQSDIFVEYYQPDWAIYERINTFPDRAHNLIFDTILQFGLIGLMTSGLLVLYIIALSMKFLNKRHCDKKYWLTVALLSVLAGYFINNLFSFSTVTGYVYYYLILAILAAVFFGHDDAPKAENELPFRSLSKILIIIALFFLSGVLIYYYNINFWRADYYFMKAKKAEVKRDCLGILNNMGKTIDLNAVSSYYKVKYIYYNLNCFVSELKSDQITIQNNVDSIIDTVSDRGHDFYMKNNIAHAKSLFGYYIDPSFYSDAELNYLELLKINSYITITYSDYGRMKLWQKDYEAAIDIFERGLKVVPSLDNSYLNSVHGDGIKAELARLYGPLGVAYNFNNDRDKALENYQKALRLDPYNFEMYKSIADVYYAKRDLDKAIWYNKRGFMLEPNDSSWPQAISLLYKEKGDEENEKYYSDLAENMKSPENK